MAIGINGLDLTALHSPFKTSLTQVTVQPSGPTRQNIHFAKCNISDWQDLGQNFDKQFKGFGFDTMLCIDTAASYSMYGYSGTLPYQYLDLQLNICNSNVTGCNMTDIAVLNFISAYTSINNMFMVRLFIVNTIISPSKDPPTSNIIDKNIIVTFTETTGTVGYASFGDFTISTDNSIWPY